MTNRRSPRRALFYICVVCLSVVVAVGIFLAMRAHSARPVSSWTPPSLAEVQAQLLTGSFDDFLESSSRLYLLRFPQVVAELGLADALGVRNDRLNDYSKEYEQETAAIESCFLDELRSFDRRELEPAQRAAYDALQWMWTSSAARRSLGFSGYAVDSTAASPDARLSRLFTTDLPLGSEQDVEDYLACLGQAAEQIREIEQLIDAEDRRGIVPPDGVLSMELASLSPLGITHMRAEGEVIRIQRISGTYHPFYVRVRELIENTAILSGDREAEIRTAALREVERRIIPAFERLHSEVSHRLSETSQDVVGIGAVPGGEESYGELLREYSGTLLGPDEVHRLAQASVERLRPEIDRVSAALGIRAGVPIVSIILYLQSGESSPDGELEAPEVVAPRSGFAMSRAQPGLLPFPAGADDGDGVPWGLAAPDPFYGFIEGCKLYLSQLTWEEEQAAMDSPRRALTALLEEYEAAVAAVVDTGIHALGWGLRTATAYYQDTVYQDSGPIPASARYAVGHLAARPGLAAGRYAAYCAIMQLRTEAQAAAGNRFSLDKFHDRLLAHGARPLELVDGSTLAGD